MRWLLGVSCVGLWACAGPPSPPPPQLAPWPRISVPPVATAVAPAAPDPCPILGANEVSEDDTPSLAGATERESAGAWLEARGVKKPAFRAWVRAHAPATLDDFDADTLFDGEDSCQTLSVGDKHEDALLCTLGERTSIMRLSAVALVVRGKRIAAVLEVGYALPAMDWPDKRWLDLQLALAADGMSADLHDRGTPGTTLVRSPRECHEHVARYEACEKAHRDGGRLDDVCPQVMTPSGTTTFGHHPPTPPPSPMGGDRIALAGCAEALPQLDALIKQTGPGDLYAAEFRADRAFAVKSCNARGHYAWKGDRFVR